METNEKQYPASLPGFAILLREAIDVGALFKGKDTTQVTGLPDSVQPFLPKHFLEGAGVWRKLTIVATINGKHRPAIVVYFDSGSGESTKVVLSSCQIHDPAYARMLVALQQLKKLGEQASLHTVWALAPSDLLYRMMSFGEEVLKDAHGVHQLAEMELETMLRHFQKLYGAMYKVNEALQGLSPQNRALALVLASLH